MYIAVTRNSYLKFKLKNWKLEQASKGKVTSEYIPFRNNNSLFFTKVIQINHWLAIN